MMNSMIGKTREPGGPEVCEKLQQALPGVSLEVERTGQLPRTRSGKVTRYIDEFEKSAS